MPTKTLPARLRRIMRHMKWSPADLAQASGASQPTVSRWLNDGQIKIDPKFAFALQDSSGFCARWILLGEGPVHAVESLTDAALPPALREEMLRHAHAVARIIRDTSR